MTWIRELDADAAAAVAVVAEHTSHSDGVAPLSGHLLQALGGGHDEYILATVDRHTIGVAVAHADDPIELFVVPEHRREGLGSELLTTSLARTGAVWAHGDLPAAQRLAAVFGLVRTRELRQLRRPLSVGWARAQVAAARLPAGVRLRTFIRGQDEQQFLGVNARAFDWHPEQGRLDLAGLEAEMDQPWFDAAGFFLAVDSDDTVLGFHWTKVHTEGPEPLGEVYVLGVDPQALIDGRRARGLGVPLTTTGLAHLAELGLRTALLYVEGDNVRALDLYRRLGFETYSTDVVYRLPG